MSSSRSEFKAYFANERTFIHWLHVSITMASFAAAIEGFSSSIGKVTTFSKRTLLSSRIISIIILALTLVMIITSMLNFLFRNKRLREGLPGPYYDRVLPVILTCMLLLIFGFIVVS